MTQIATILQCYRLMVEALQIERATQFPLGSVVYIKHPRFTGCGIVTSYCGPPDCLGVRLENGNEWLYEIDTAKPSPKREQWPPWIKREMRRRKAKHA